MRVLLLGNCCLCSVLLSRRLVRVPYMCPLDFQSFPIFFFHTRVAPFTMVQLIFSDATFNVLLLGRGYFIILVIAVFFSRVIASHFVFKCGVFFYFFFFFHLWILYWLLFLLILGARRPFLILFRHARCHAIKLTVLHLFTFAYDIDTLLLFSRP